MTKKKQSQKKIRNSIPRKTIRASICIQIFLLIIIFAIINYISFNYYWRADFSRSHRFSLADQTGQALQSLRKPAKIYAITSPTARAMELSLYPDLKNLLKELQLAAKGKLSVEFVDPTRDPIRARALQARFQYGDKENLVILEYDGRSRFITMAELGNFDSTHAYTADGQQPPRLVTFRGEQVLTDTIISLLNPNPHKVFFLEGNGELQVNAPDSQLSTLVDYARRQNIDIEPIQLKNRDSVPLEATAVVIVAPQLDFSAEDIEKLKTYWDRGGNFMMLFNPNMSTPHLYEFVSSLGIQPEDNRILRNIQQGFSTSIDKSVRGEFLPKAEPSKRFMGSTAYFPGSTQSLKLQPQIAKKNQLQLRPLIQASKEYWGERNYKNKEAQYDEAQDVAHPLVVAASAERDGLKDERVQIQSAKLVVVGNGEFVMNRWLGGTNAGAANLDFLLGCLNWLVDRGKLAAIVPKATNNFYLNLPDSELHNIAFNTMIVMPGVAALIGVFVWLKRRK